MGRIMSLSGLRDSDVVQHAHGVLVGVRIASLCCASLDEEETLLFEAPYGTSHRALAQAATGSDICYAELVRDSLPANRLAEKHEHDLRLGTGEETQVLVEKLVWHGGVVSGAVPWETVEALLLWGLFLRWAGHGIHTLPRLGG